MSSNGRMRNIGKQKPLRKNKRCLGEKGANGCPTHHTGVTREANGGFMYSMNDEGCQYEGRQHENLVAGGEEVYHK